MIIALRIVHASNDAKLMHSFSTSVRAIDLASLYVYVGVALHFVCS